MAKQTKVPGGTPPQKKAPVHDWGEESVTGMENVSTEDLGIPFLVILQKGSPEVDRTHKDHKSKKIEGAEVGDVINSVTREVLHKCEGDPVVFIPCTYKKMYPEWRPRESGGGFVKHHEDVSILSKCERSEEDGRDYLPNGNVIVTTAYFFGYTIDEGGNPQPCVISMKSADLKASRAWLNIITGLKVESPTKGRITPPMFSHKYALSTVPMQNEKGSWFGWAVETHASVTESNLIEFGRSAAKQMGLGQNRPQLSAPKEQGDVV